MNLTFISKIEREEGNNKIEFTAPVVLKEENGWTIYEFEEPQNNVMNRIEIHFEEGYVNIFAGPLSTNLSLNKEVTIEYTIPKGPSFFMVGKMLKLEKDKTTTSFVYTLRQGEKDFGKYTLSLTIK